MVESMSSEDRKTKQFKWITVLQPVNETFCEAHFCRTYRLEKTLEKYDLHMASKTDKMARSLDITMKTQKFNSSDAVTILSFSQTFKSEYEANGIQEGSAMCLFNYFMKETSKAPLNSSTTHKEKNERQGDMVMRYCATVRHWINTYETDESFPLQRTIC